MSETPAYEQGDGADPDAPLISLQDVSVHFETETSYNPFSDPETVKAVDDVSVDIGENEVVVLVGESGSGKTTLGKAAIGLQRPTEGSIEYRGQDIWNARDGSGPIDVPYESIRRSLQVIHQDPESSLNPMRTVLDILSEPLRRWEDDLDANGRRERIFSTLDQVKLRPAPDYASRYPHQLSGGEKQRVALVRALLLQPDLVLADEAVSALDVSLRVEMMDLMLELQDVFDTSYLFISHNLSNARYIAQKTGGRIGVMYLGNLVEIGEPDEILDNPKHPYTQILRLATPSLTFDDEDAEEMGGPPVREMDIPSAVDPPSGCRFHTRCPFARETCTQETPQLEAAHGGQPVACFRQYNRSEHPYWESSWLDETAAEQYGDGSWYRSD